MPLNTYIEKFIFNPRNKKNKQMIYTLNLEKIQEINLKKYLIEFFFLNRVRNSKANCPKILKGDPPIGGF